MSARNGPPILLVEDDEDLRSFLADNLCADGYEPVPAHGVEMAWRLLRARGVALAIVDVELPDGSGFDLVRRVREADGVAGRVDPRLPLVVLSGHAGELDRLRGFERGADDYVGKPFSYPELRLRLRAILRRSRGAPAGGSLRVGDLTLDPVAREVCVRGAPVELSQKEYALLRALASAPTRVYTKEELLRDVWGFRSLGNSRTLDSHACRLRSKLAARGAKMVVNVWGVGYRLIDGPVER